MPERPVMGGWKKGPVVALLVLSAAASAAAQSGDAPQAGGSEAREQARVLFERGNTLMQNENWEVALAEFRRSFELYPTRSALFNLAMCEMALHRYRAALGHFADWQERYGAAAPEDEGQRVARTIEDIGQFIGFLVVSSNPAGASVQVDGEEVGTTPLAAPVSLDAERHVLEVVLAGHRPVRQEILVSPLETVNLALTLEVEVDAPPEIEVAVPEAPPPVAEADAGLDSAWFWTTASTAVALGLGGAISGGIALDTRADLDDLAARCRTGDRASCDEGRGRVDDLDAAETATSVLLLSAAGIAVATVVLAFFTDLAGDEESPVAAGIAPAAGPDGAAAGANLWLALTF